eukprot:1110295-Pleurochrysis_carterae.AAC.1
MEKSSCSGADRSAITPPLSYLRVPTRAQEPHSHTREQIRTEVDRWKVRERHTRTWRSKRRIQIYYHYFDPRCTQPRACVPAYSRAYARACACVRVRARTRACACVRARACACVR